MAEQPNEPTPILVLLRAFQDTENNSLTRFASTELKPLRFWVVAVRAQLERIYGRNSQYLTAFPVIPENLSNAEVPATFMQRTAQLSRIIEDLEVIVTNAAEPIRRRQTLKCFLSYRFTDENEILALRVQEFLKLLDVEVRTGNRYEPRQVSEKVLSILREPFDCIVLLITANGESMWTRDEINTAIHKGIHLIPLVEKGVTFQPGLFADLEYIEFAPGHIGDVFLKLLQAIQFIRGSEGSSVNSGVSKMEDWRSKYSLIQTPGGATVYASPGNSPPYACPSCFGKGIEQILQDRQVASGHFRCPSCQFDYPIKPRQSTRQNFAIGTGNPLRRPT
jgi:hypothetical protein